MAAVPAPRTWVAGEIVTAAYMNNTIRDVENFLLAPPVCFVLHTTGQSIATGSSFTSITFDSEVVDNSGMHSTVSNTSRLTAVYPGYYDTGGGVAFAGAATGRRMNNWRVNGSDMAGSAAGQPATTLTVANAARSIQVYLNVGDYLEEGAQQDSGGPVSLFVGTAGWQPSAKAVWTSN